MSTVLVLFHCDEWTRVWNPSRPGLSQLLPEEGTRQWIVKNSPQFLIPLSSQCALETIGWASHTSHAPYCGKRCFFHGSSLFPYATSPRINWLLRVHPVPISPLYPSSFGWQIVFNIRSDRFESIWRSSREEHRVVHPCASHRELLPQVTLEQGIMSVRNDRIRGAVY